MATVIPDDGTSFLPHPQLFSAIQHFAESQAVLAAACLAELKAEFETRGDTFPASFPAGFLLEIGAIAQIVRWEACGVDRFLPSNTLKASEAAADLQRRYLADRHQFYNLASSSLARFVLRIWLENFAWDAAEILNAEVALGHVDEDRLVDAVAELMWSMRHRTRNFEN